MAGLALVDYATEHLLTVTVTGACLHNSVYVPFGDMESPEEFFMSTNYGDIKLKLKGGAGLGVTSVVTQQLRR